MFERKRKHITILLLCYKKNLFMPCTHFRFLTSYIMRFLFEQNGYKNILSQHVFIYTFHFCGLVSQHWMYTWCYSLKYLSNVFIFQWPCQSALNVFTVQLTPVLPTTISLTSTRSQRQLNCHGRSFYTAHLQWFFWLEVYTW